MASIPHETGTEKDKKYYEAIFFIRIHAINEHTYNICMHNRQEQGFLPKNVKYKVCVHRLLWETASFLFTSKDVCIGLKNPIFD